MRTSLAGWCVLHWCFAWVVLLCVDIWLCSASVLLVLLLFCWYFIVRCMGFTVLLVFQCVLNCFYRFVGISVCIALVLSRCWYLIVYYMGFIVLLIFNSVLHGFIVALVFDCVFHMFYRFVCICMGFIVLLIFHFALHGFYGFVCISW